MSAENPVGDSDGVGVVDGLGDLLDAGLIKEILFEVKSGKEATVYCCRSLPLLLGEGRGEGVSARDDARARLRANPTLTPNPSPKGRGELVAAKVYRELAKRGFRNSAIYQAGRVHLARSSRVQRAAENRSAFGMKVEQALWIDHEWTMLHRLFDAGLDVPQPIARGERAILMPFMGDERTPAPMLHAVEFGREAASVVDRLLWNVERMLDSHVVHGDLSPFNVMWHDGKAVIIDLPQAVDPRLNPAALSLLSRDVGNICDWAARWGVMRDAARITAELWSGFIEGEIG